jgi:hypothetical protein
MTLCTCHYTHIFFHSIHPLRSCIMAQYMLFSAAIKKKRKKTKGKNIESTPITIWIGNDLLNSGLALSIFQNSRSLICVFFPLSNSYYFHRLSKNQERHQFIRPVMFLLVSMSCVSFSLFRKLRHDFKVIGGCHVGMWR